MSERAISTQPRYWHSERDADGIHWLSLDKAEASTNTLSQDVLAAFAAVLDELDGDRPKGLVIRSAKPNGFIAGADVDEFRGLSDPKQVEELIRRGHALLDRLEKLSFPTVALIHGFCLGGGLELALACRYRIAAEDARLGFPEVRLGIHPGLGGTVRATRVMPSPAALNLMLTGRTVRARQARALGLVDVVTQPRHFERAARTAIKDGLKTRRKCWLIGLSNAAPVRPPLAWYMRRQVSKKARPEHYPAPYALIDLWARHGGSRSAMFRAEAASVAKLITGDTAQNLVRVFFLSEALKSLGKEADFPVGHVHVLGAGTMGGDIAAWCALQGLRVTLQDREPRFIAPAIGRAASLFKRRLRQPALARAALDRLVPDLAGIGIRHADLVIEAIPEELELKQRVFRDLEAKMKPEAVLATNTSSIPLEQLDDVLDRPDRLVGLHFFNPVAQMPLLEVVRGEATGNAALAAGFAFARRIDKLPLPVRSVPGFLVNRVLTPYLMEAVLLLEDGHSPTAIDAAAEAFGMPMGPLELADTVGLDVCLHVGRILGAANGIEPPKRLISLVEAGNLGRKSGGGFYRYQKGKAVKSKRDAEVDAAGTAIRDRLMLPLLNTAVACLREGVVDDADHLDAGLIFGAGFAPFRGGPLHYIGREGAAQFREKLETLERKHGPRFKPDPGWETL